MITLLILVKIFSLGDTLTNSSVESCFHKSCHRCCSHLLHPIVLTHPSFIRYLYLRSLRSVTQNQTPLPPMSLIFESWLVRTSNVPRRSLSSMNPLCSKGCMMSTVSYCLFTSKQSRRESYNNVWQFYWIL